MIRRVRRDVRSDDVFRDITVGRREIPAVFENGALYGPRRLQLLELGTGYARIPKTPSSVPQSNLHHSIRTHVREGIDEDAVDDAEHGARCTDAKGEREDRGDRKPGPPAQLARGVAKIGKHGAHISQLGRVPGGQGWPPLRDGGLAVPSGRRGWLPLRDSGVGRPVVLSARRTDPVRKGS